MGNNCCSQPAETVKNFDLKKGDNHETAKAESMSLSCQRSGASTRL